MIKSLILYVILLFSVFANTVYAADPENIMVIEVEGAANGIIEIKLLPDVAPLHVERIKILARDGLYNDVVFHRVIDGFMAQTGDVKFGKIKGYPCCSNAPTWDGPASGLCPPRTERYRCMVDRR